MNTLDFFRGLEDSHKGQGDLFEGVDSIIAKEDFREESLRGQGINFSGFFIMYKGK